MSTLEVVVATIGKAHGLRGEVSLILRTDQPEERLAAGTTFTVPGAPGGELTVSGTRVQQGRWYARFAQITDRTAAEQLRGTDLELAVDRDQEQEDDPDAWYPSELIGLAVQDAGGVRLGTVVDLEHYPAQDLLIVRTPAGRRVMLPFVEELVPEIDCEAGIIHANPPGGLFDDAAGEAAGPAADRDKASPAVDADDPAGRA